MDQSYKPVLLEIDNSRGTTENVGIEFAQVYRQTHGPVVGDAPPTSGKEIAALIFKDGPETRSRRFVYTFPRCRPNETCTRPRFVPLWSPMYSSLQYPLLLFRGEPGWSSGSTKEDRSPRKQSAISRSCRCPNPVVIAEHAQLVDQIVQVCAARNRQLQRHD